MALMIRLRQQGRTNRLFYRLVVTDSRTRRDGKYTEMVGWYNPLEKEDEKVLSIKPDRIKFWIEQGAQLSERAEALVARAAPEIIKEKTQRTVAKRAKAQAKRKSKKAAKK